MGGSTGGKRRPVPHGHGSLRPSFSTSSVPVPMTRSPRLTLDSLEGTPGGVCWPAQKGRLSAVIAVHGRPPVVATSTRIAASADDRHHQILGCCTALRANVTHARNAADQRTRSKRGMALLLPLLYWPTGQGHPWRRPVKSWKGVPSYPPSNGGTPSSWRTTSVSCTPPQNAS